MNAEADFSRQELKNFLNKLADQIATGRIDVHIPGDSGGRATVIPEQPIDVVFSGEDEELDITMKLVEKRKIE